MQDEHYISVEEFCTHLNIEKAFIRSLYDQGLIELTTVEEDILLPLSQLVEVEQMIRLHYDLNVNIEGIDVIRHILKRLEEAQERIYRLKNRLRFYGDTDE
ncbi:MerR family transcriptional regulator [Flaviaesturariibacter flavus]|uniref:MerR family transcriptional regulator n=1 Tax=Flaviaesturariibacter flavus TaxID=2502780 RepID=A0A4V6NAZ5_9BACT|nr:chaperone modulator CbpM [Flaviaesturariibacter flavus]TCJ14592.1 MerR family transcriptional regulator [Flaviaesturariibacter flavus]